MFLNNYGVLGICMISICIITKNEEDKLQRCLECVKNLGYEIVVTDTGSTDNTVEIAKRFTKNVYYFKWIDDFSAARNFCASKASNDFVFALDADEFVLDFDKNVIETTLKKHPDYIGAIKRNEISATIGEDESSRQTAITYATRIYNKNLFHYVGFVHEQIRYISGQGNEIYVKFPVTADHVGYMQSLEQKKAKSKRELNLLQKQLQTGEDKEYTMYQIGKAYAYSGELVKAYGFLKATMDFDIDPKKDWVIDMMITYMVILIELKQYDEALQLQGVYDVFDYCADFVYYMGKIYELTGNLEPAILEYKKATTLTDFYEVGRNSFYAYDSLGDVYVKIGDVENAKKYYKKALPYQPAREKLEKLK